MIWTAVRHLGALAVAAAWTWLAVELIRLVRDLRRSLAAEIAQRAGDVEPDETLWAMHVMGPDDIIAMPDRETAQERADEVNAIVAQLKTRPGASDLDPGISAAVIEWPGTPQEHADELAEHGTEYTP